MQTDEGFSLTGLFSLKIRLVGQLECVAQEGGGGIRCSIFYQPNLFCFTFRDTSCILLASL